MNFLMKLRTYWYQHGQKSLASATACLIAVDFTPWADDFHDLLPWPHWHSVLKLLGLGGIIWRASQAKSTPQSPP